MPKYGLDIPKCEVARLYKVTNNFVEPISFRVPRKSDAFQPDIFPGHPCSKASTVKATNTLAVPPRNQPCWTSRTCTRMDIRVFLQQHCSVRGPGSCIRFIRWRKTAIFCRSHAITSQGRSEKQCGA